MGRQVLHKKQIGDHEYYVRSVTVNGTVRFPDGLVQEISESVPLEYGDALGFRLLRMEKPEQNTVFIVEVIPLKLSLQPIS